MKRVAMPVLCVLALLFVSMSVKGQRLYFCEDYTAEGEPTGIASSWTIPSDGANVYMLYKQSYNISTPTIYLYVDKMTDGTYKEYSTKALTPDKYKSWLVYDYKFTEIGSYKVTILDASKTTLATEYVTIDWSSDSYTEEEDEDYGDNFMYSEVIFCTDVNSSGPTGTGTTFNINKSTGSYIYVYIKNDKTFGTKGFKAHLYKKTSGDNYDFVNTSEWDISPDLTATYFKHTFYEKGDYKFILYTDEDAYINTGYVTIQYK
jgi:hypothetical protein